MAGRSKGEAMALTELEISDAVNRAAVQIAKMLNALEQETGRSVILAELTSVDVTGLGDRHRREIRTFEIRVTSPAGNIE